MIDNFDLESFFLGILFVLILAIIIMMILCLREYIRFKLISRSLNKDKIRVSINKILRNELEFGSFLGK
jgi:hypothetical protein